MLLFLLLLITGMSIAIFFQERKIASLTATLQRTQKELEKEKANKALAEKRLANLVSLEKSHLDPSRWIEASERIWNVMTNMRSRMAHNMGA